MTRRADARNAAAIGPQAVWATSVERATAPSTWPLHPSSRTAARAQSSAAPGQLSHHGEFIETCLHRMINCRWTRMKRDRTEPRRSRRIAFKPWEAQCAVSDGAAMWRSGALRSFMRTGGGRAGHRIRNRRQCGTACLRARSCAGGRKGQHERGHSAAIGRPQRRRSAPKCHRPRRRRQ